MGDGAASERYLKESSKSYKGCLVKNSARRNSLQKKTMGIEVERKMASAERNRETKQLREQLKYMQIERDRTTTVKDRTLLNKVKDKKTKDSQRTQIPASDVNPYPVTFISAVPFRSRANTLEDNGKHFAAKRGRRQSKEFEDLHINTATGTLALPRVNSLANKGSGVSSLASLSPSTPRRAINTSTPSVESDGDSHWVGEPEAIGSVRRPRKTVEEQEKDRMYKRVQTEEARLKGEH